MNQNPWDGLVPLSKQLQGPYRVASLFQELLGLTDSAPHGRAGHGEEIGFVVAYAEGFCAGIHLQGEEDAAWKGASGASSTSRPGGESGKQHLLCSGAHPWVRGFHPAALPRDLQPPGSSVPLH